MLKPKYILLICLIIRSSLLQSQDWNRVFQYEMDAEYYMADKQFDKAIDSYTKALKVVPNSSNLKFKLAYCYLNSDDKKLQALEYLEEAAKDATNDYKPSSIKEIRSPIESVYLLARTYQISLKFDKAIEAYNRYKELLSPEDKIRSLVDQNIASCKNAKAFIADSVSIKMKNLGNLINNDQPNINAVVSGDGKTLVFTTISKAGNDIFVSTKNGEKWSAPTKITGQLGNKYLLTCFLSYDGKDLYLSSDDPENSDIYVSTLEKNKWIKALKFSKPINTKANENYACVTKDGNTIYFSSDRKGGVGGFDIYKSNVNEKGTWGEPVNIGSSINTEFNDIAPFLSPDEKYLFFSSEGHGSMGGYDIFYVNLTGNPKVENLGYPMNTPDNDIFFSPENNWKSGYVSVYNKNSLGKKDIFHVDIERYISLDGRIVAEENEKDATSSPFRVAIVNASTNDTIKIINSNDKSFSTKLIAGSYSIAVKNKKFIPFSESLSIPADYTEKAYPFEAQLKPVVIEKPVVAIAEVVVPKENKVDTSNANISIKIKPKEEPKKPKKEEKKEIKKEVPKEKPKENKKKAIDEVKVTPKQTSSVIKVVKNDNSTSFKVTTYSVQLMALTKDVGPDYFKNIKDLEISLTPENIYRYSVGTTESMEDAMTTLKRVKELGYSNAFIRIDKVTPSYTIQLMALKKPVELNYFNNLDGVNVSKGIDGFYRYSYGSYATAEEAKNSLQQVVGFGYKNAFIKRLVVK